MRLRIATVTAVFRSAFANPDLREVGFAYALFSSSEFGTWIILLVYAYARGGVSAELLISLVQLLPCVVLAPLIGSVSERWPPARALAVGYAVQAVAIGAVGAAMAAGSPAWVVYALSPLTTLAFCITRPSQSALLPSVVRTAEELTAANVLTGWTEGLAGLVGPGLAGVLLAWRGTAAATVAMSLLVVASTLLVVRVIRRAPASLGSTGGGGAPGGPADRHDPARRAGARAHVAATLHNPHIRVLLVLTLFFYVLVGALDYLCVVLALGLLHMGPGGAGYLNAALGVGELAAGLVTAFLVGRHPLAPTLLGSLLGSVAALALVAAWPRAGVALAVFVVVGLTLAVFNATSKTLMQRAVPADAIAGSFAVVESLMNLGLAVGSVLIWVGVRAVGARASLLAPAVATVLVVAALWRRLHEVDAGATIPQVEIRLLRSIRIFAPLPAPTLETVARELEMTTVPAGTRVIAEGAAGDRYYAVADGELDVTRGGRLLGRIGRGDGFGEIALIRDVPRTASVTAVTDTILYGLDGELFVETVTGNVSAVRAVGEVVDGHLGGGGSTPG